ncbi:DUF4347 domain-containing protein [Salinarimonas chemoclinalis]|uniref:DUF4347 domain-containing protein n=1 Tax=Salinarimonas chemoclinalis TaxID=3241599 RepID=UPI0035568D39
MAWKHRDPWTRAPLTMALEPRIMFDAAGAATYFDAADGADVAVAETKTPPPVEIVFVDTTIEGYRDLVDDIAGTKEVILLDARTDALHQIAAALDGRSDVAAIHILSHGDVGALSFGSGRVDGANLDGYSDVLARIGAALVEGGDILLYGCSVGADETGVAFLEAFARATNADVAASDNLTGASEANGDWVLEWNSGTIDVASISSSGFSGTLNVLGANFDYFGGFRTGVILDPGGPEFQFGGVGGTAVQADITANQIIFTFTQNGSLTPSELVFYGTNLRSIDSVSIASSTFAAPTVSLADRDAVAGDGALTPGTDGFNDTIVIGAFNYVSGGQLIINFTSTGFNDPPVIANLDGDTLAYIEDAGALVLDQGAAATVTDADSPNFDTGTLTVAITGGNANEDLGIVNQGTGAGQIGVAGSTVTFGGVAIGTITANGQNGANLVVTFNANSSPAAAAALINAITYSNDSQNPTGSRTVGFTLTDGDGGTSATSNVTVNLTPVNDPPTLTATGNTPTFTEGDAAPGADLFSGVTISTVEAGQTITGLTLTISNVTDGASEILRIDGSDVALTNGNSVLTATNGLTVTVSVTGATATVSFAGAGLTTAAAQTLVDGLAYRNTSENPTEANRVATITQIRDSGGVANGGVDVSSPNVAATVTVVGVNDAPTLTGGGVLPAVDEDTANPPGAALSALGITAVDVDGTVTGYAVVGNTANAGTQGVWQYSTNGGTNWFAVGAVADDATALALSSATLVRFVPVADFNGAPPALTIRAVDSSYAGGFSSTAGTETRATLNAAANGGATAVSAATATITTSIDPVNDPPVLTATAANPTYVENVGTQPLLQAGAAVTDVDITNAAATGTVTGATLTVSLTAGAFQAQDIFGIADVNGITFDAGTGHVTIGGDVVATLAGGLGANAVVTFTALASLNSVNAVLGALVYSNAGDDPTQGGTNTTRAYQIVYNDSALNSAAVTGTVTITAVNDAPVVTTSGGSAAYVENAAGVPIDPGLTVSDPDSGTLASATVSITGGFQAGQDVLAFVNDGATMGNVTASWNAGTGVLTLTSAGGTATLLQWQAALRAVTFANGSEDPSTAARTVSFVVNDGDASSTAATRGVTVTAVNDSPTNDPAFGFVNAGASTETGGIVTITNAMLNEGDPDDSGAGVTYTVTTATTNGTLFRDANGNGIVDGGEALGLNATFTQADIDGGLIKYLHGGGGGSSDSFGFSVADGGEDGATPLTGQTFSITIAARPVLTIGGGAPAHVEDAGATIVAPNLTLSDADSANLTGATVTITDRVVGDVLNFVDQNGITGSYDAGTGVLTLTGTATLANYQAALRSITYSTTNDNPATGAGNADRVISFTVTDGALNSTVQSQTVTVANANDAPVLDPSASPALVGIAEDLGPPTNGSTAGSTLVSALLAGMSDVDTGAVQGMAIVGTSAQGTLWYSLDGGTTWVQVPAVSAGAALLLQSDARLYLQPAANVNGTIADVLTFRAWDRTSGTNGGTADTTTNGGSTAFSIATDTVSVTIAAVNDAPTVNAGPLALTATDEKTTSTATTVAAILAGLGYADVDFSSAADARADGGIAITGTSGNGVWQYSTNGTDWFAVGATSTTVALLLDASAQLRYVPDGVDGETASLSLRGWDRTVGTATSGATRGTSDTSLNGGIAAFSATVATASLFVAAVDDAPTLGGLVLGQAVTDKTTVQPFATATVADVDSANVTVTVTLDVAAKGSLAGGGFTAAGGGVYTFTGAPAAAEAALRALVFTPAQNRVAPGATETTTFTVAVADATTTTQGTASVVSTSVNDALAAGGFTVPVQGVLDTGTVTPFAGVTIADPDVGQQVTVTVTLDAAAKGGFGNLGGFVHAGNGVYTLTAADAAAAQAALRGLVFQPTPNRVAPGLVETTTFTVSVSDGVAPAVVDAGTRVEATSVNDAPSAVGSVPAQVGTPDEPFSLRLPADLFTDPDVGDAVTVSVQGLPAGFAFDPVTGTISGTPTTPGETSFTIVGTDRQGARATIVVPFSIGVPPVATEPPTLAPVPEPVLPPPPAPLPPPPAPNPSVPPAALPAENFGGVGSGLSPAQPPSDPIVPSPGLPEPVTPRPNSFLAPSDGGSAYSPGFAIRAEPSAGSFVARSGAGPITFGLPPATFVVENGGVQVLVGATLADGSPLPVWVEFDPATGTFTIDAPPGFTGELDVVITATLPTGEAASTTIEIAVEAAEEAPPAGQAPAGDGEDPLPRQDGALEREPALRTADGEVPGVQPLVGKPAFSEAVKAASRGAWATQGEDFLDSLIAILPAGQPSGDMAVDSRNGREAA